MGCRRSRAFYATTSVENTEVVRFENTWNVHKVPFQELEAICRRSTTASYDKILSMLISTFNLSIPPDLFEKSSITHGEFLSFFIMLGKGTNKEKNLALWYMFDSNFDRNLEKSDFKKLLKTIIRPSVEVTVKYYIGKMSSNLMSAWYQQLTERIESLEIRLLKHFLAENERISLENYMIKCEEMPLGMICSVSALRTQLEHTQVIPTRFANPFKTMKVTKLTS
ncbi:hypothetical protein SteCoe_37336 [Stentor coeruleus]|uniref:EF-hand domain-containing protein n=1 Tax=Stentor coeruleus TaxID=5963 RepID=A0A1R2AN79_9CILI|nr:hypothetical protein SteCoe_37336 [Stentor coeruleus]